MTGRTASGGWEWELASAVPSEAARPAIAGYVLGELLGAGGMGRVYRALDPAGREVAVKVLPRSEMTPRAVARFEREAELLARHRHPGVLTVHAWARTDAACYLVCELVEGEHLDVAAQALDLEARLDLIEEAARAVAAVHALGVVHRDLKPSNVLVDHHGRPRVIDLGLALRAGVDRLTQTGQFVGTPLYAPPERLGDSRAADAPTADVWSLGAMAYEVLTGEHPYPAATVEDLGRRLHSRPGSPRRLVPALSRGVAAVLLRALDPAPAARHPDAAAFAEALATARRAAPWRGRLRVGLAAGAALAAAALGGVASLAPPPREVARTEPSPPPADPGGQDEDPLAEPTAPDPADRPPAPSLVAGLGGPAQALVACERWPELRALLAGRSDLPPDLRRLRGLAALLGGELEAAREDLEERDPLLVLERMRLHLTGDLAVATATSSAPAPLLTAVERLVAAAARAERAGGPATAAVLARVQRSARDALWHLATTPAAPAARVGRTAEVAAGLGEGPAALGLTAIRAWADLAEELGGDAETRPLVWIREQGDQLPAFGPWLAAQPEGLRTAVGALLLVVTCERGEAVPPPLFDHVSATLGRLAHGRHARAVYRLATRWLGSLERDAACAAFRRGEAAAAERHLVRARAHCDALARGPDARVSLVLRALRVSLALLEGRVGRARQEAREIEGGTVRLLLQAECDLVQRRLDWAERRLARLQGRRRLAPYVARLEVHRRVLAGELAAEEALAQVPDGEPEADPSLFQEWHSVAGLRDVLRGGWWPGRER